MSVATGIVKFFDDKKGYGFVTDESGDLYVHRSQLPTNGPSLYPGLPVTFHIEVTPRGRRAVNVQIGVHD